jgi:replicative DNA helicase
VALTRSAPAAADRVPPQNLEAERACLGAMLLGHEGSREAIAKAVVLAAPRDYYRTGHQKIADAIASLFNQGEKVDLITVAEHLRKSGDLQLVGGEAYIAGLVDEMPLVANIEEYAGIIKEKAVLRRLMEIAARLYGNASEDATPGGEVLNNASQSLYDLMQDSMRGNMLKMESLVLNEVEHIEALSSRATTDMVTGIATGFKQLDEMTSGLQRGELIVIAARPGQGKTSFMMNMVDNVCNKHKNTPVIVFSLEMSASSLVRRMICAHARVDSQRVRRGHLYPEDKANLMQSYPILSQQNIWIDDSSRLTPLELRAKARRVIAESKAQDAVVIVDYLQLLDAGHERNQARMESRQAEIAFISRTLKGVAKDLNVPVVVASQLSRAMDKRDEKNRRPRLSDLRESGAIEQDADVVVFLYREEKKADASGQKEDMRHGWVSQCSIAKQRNGPTGRFQLYFNREFTRFDSIENSEIQPEDE